MPLRFRDIVLSESERTVTRNGVSLHLTPKAFDLLVVLASEAPRVVSKSELHSRVWPDTFVSDATLVGVIKELRHALDGESDESCIRTVNRVGYALATPTQSQVVPPVGDAWHWLVSNGRHLALRNGENRIGRDPASALFLDAAGVSRIHACVRVSSDAVLLEDLGSKNGTRVGGLRVEGRVVLRDGDRIEVGTETLVYRCSTSGLSTVSLSTPLTKSATDPST